MAKVGRPTVFTPEVLDKVLDELSQGVSERSIFREEGMPTWRAWWKYKETHPEFIQQYAQAKEQGLAAWEEEINKIAADDSRDLQPDGKGGFKSDNTAVNRDRLRIDTKKWLMSKLMPKKYGEKSGVEVSGPGGEAIGVVFIGAKSDPTKT